MGGQSKKNVLRACRLTRFYGIDPRGLSRAEQHAWEANINTLWAEEVLRERSGSLAPDQLYYLTLLATGDRARAEKARARRWLEQRRAQ